MPTVDDLGKTSGLFADKPIATVAAFFALAFAALLVWHMRASAKQQETLLSLAVRFEHLSTKTYEVMRDCRDALDRKRGPRPVRTKTDPTQVTVTLDPKEVADGETEG